MGDRGIIVVDDGCSDYQVGLYSHWFGNDLLRILREALSKGQSQWDDPPYLARVIFCEMILTDNTNDGLTGFGIHVINLSEFPGVLIDYKESIIVNTPHYTIKIGNKTLSFKELLSLEITDLDTIYE